MLSPLMMNWLAGILLCGCFWFINHIRLIGNTEVCSSGDCRDVGQYFSNHINTSENVCRFAYDYYCANVIDQDVLNTQKQLISTNFTGNVSSKKFDLEAANTAIQFYENCLSAGERWFRNLFPKDVIGSMLSTIIHWPDLLVLAREYGINHNFFFTITVALDDATTNTRWIIEMSKPKYYPKVFDSRNVGDLMALCSYWRESCGDAKEIEDVIEFAQKFIGMANAIDVNKNVPRSSLIRIEELQNKTVLVGSWLEFLKKMTNVNTLSDSDEILYDLTGDFPTGLDYLEELERLFVEYGTKTWLNYFAINLILDECYFLPENIQKVCSKYLLGTKERFCSEKTISNFEGVLEYAYASDYSRALSSTLMEMVDDLKDSFLEGFVERFKPSDTVRETIETYLKATKVVVGHDGLYDETQFDREYKNYKKDTDVSMGLLGEDRTLRRRHYNRKFSLLDNTTPMEEKLAPTKLPGAKAAVYRKDVNKIFLMPFAVESPLFTSERPLYLNYGGLGVIIGRELTRAVFHSCPEAEQYINSDITTIACINSQYGYMLRSKKHVRQTLGKLEENMTETFLEMIGTYTAYRTYRNRYTDIGATRRVSIPGFDETWTRDQLFWMMANVPNCYEIGGYFRKLSDSHRTPAHRIHIPSMNSGSFKRAYGCPKCHNCHIFMADD